MRISDWSSDVCSSDLSASGAGAGEAVLREDRCGLVAPEKIVGRAHGGTVAAGDDRQRVDDGRRRLVGKGVDDPYPRRDRGVGLVDDAGGHLAAIDQRKGGRSEEHTSDIQSLMRISYAVFCLKQ